MILIKRLLFIAVINIAGLSAYSTNYYFFVQFANKKGTSYSLTSPSQYLSARSIARREAFGIAIDSTDLPVNQSYVDQLIGKGMNVLCRSKWFNGATVSMSDSSIMKSVRALPFVKKVQYTGKSSSALSVPQRAKSVANDINYGTAANQINQLKLSTLHNAGFKGENIMIGVLDAGFYNADVNPGMDSLRLQGRLLGTKNIPAPGVSVFTEDSHGANVLSIMSGNLPASYVGAAPEASYWLIRTEYAATENLMETDFWDAGIEFADSVGVDVVNSSLGYTTFDDATMNFTYADMNGKVSRASIAAGLASAKGIIVCNSAGNEGSSYDTWHYIGSPADADGIVTVGAVDVNGISSSFSSWGPTSDGRIKPEICAVGSATALINTGGVADAGSGTSYSCPLITGAMACFLQYVKATKPSVSVPEILSMVFRTGSHYSSPTDQQGYGIPDFGLAMSNLVTFDVKEIAHWDNAKIILDRNYRLLNISLSQLSAASNSEVSIYSVTGRVMMMQHLSGLLTLISLQNVPAGVYLIRLKINNKIQTGKFILN